MQLPTNYNFKNITNQKFDRLLVLQYLGLNEHEKILWLCRCDCGNTVIKLGIRLRQNKKHACPSCLKWINPQSPTYGAWYNMIARCHKPTHKMFKYYGERNITVCNEWRFGDGNLSGFRCFVRDMGERPSKGYTLDRKNNALGYVSDNCIWVSMAEQTRNKRNNRWLTFNGQTQIIADWAKQYNLPRNTLNNRLKKGWDVEKALTTPSGHYPRALKR